MTKPRWKPEDDERLRWHVEHSHFRKQSLWYEYVSQQMGRTAGAIQQRCFILRLRPQKLRCCPTCRRPLP